MKMVDVGAKAKTERVAIAEGKVWMSPRALERIRTGTVEKGDVIAAARLAGIRAAKRAPDIIPLCHPIGLAGVELDASLEEGGVALRARVKTVDRTGVEMEALAAVAAAALTVYDMLKSVDRGMRIDGVQLVHKSGGRSGTWHRDGQTADLIRADRRKSKPGVRAKSREER
jgi:cyclic pyranopterin monophosphate synthase